MSAPVIPCDSCGSPIPDSDLETGAAVTLLGKRFCTGCKTEAIQSVSLDDLGSPPTPGAARAASPKTPARPANKTPSRAAGPTPPTAPAKPAAPKAPPAASAPPRPERKAAPRRPVEAASAPSRTPLLIAVAAAVVVVAIVAIVLSTRDPSSTPSEPKGTTKGGTTTGTTPAVTAQDREALARDAYAMVDELARRAGTSWDLILAAAEKARPTCRGTAWEKKLEDLRVRAVQEKESEDAARDLAPLLDELRGAVTTDPEFKRFAELQPKFQLALEMAAKTGSVKMPEIRAIQKDYNGKYEKLAEPHYNRINEAATGLADERRYDDALREINSFPQNLRYSKAWTNLEKLKQDIERRKKQAPSKK